MRVGIAIPTRNALPWIETCLTTVNAQTHACAAYIVDDGSTDGTYEFLRDRPSWWRSLHRNPEATGWPQALNQAAASAIDDGCDAVFVMNADDFLRLDCIERCARVMQRCDAAVPYTQQIGGENVVQASAGHVTLADFVDHTPLVAFTLVRAAVWQGLGGYDPAVNLPGLKAGYNEWDWWVRFHLAGRLHLVDPEPTVYYRVHDGQLSHRTTGRHDLARRMVIDRHPGLADLARQRDQQHAQMEAHR